ncbi:MAG TPA: YezD family protein [Chthoniobacteraceae bacterium]|nr:YezD family protein [Chthoniobacteraceae bacterium]
MKTKTETAITTEAHLAPSWLKLVRERVSGLRFGTIQIVVHEGRVTQVDSTERTRLPADESAAA